VTFLFSDIEGSTRLWEEHPDAMRPALARHDEIVREAIESGGGCLVKMTGDGVHAAFATADAAVRAAVDAQLGLLRESWSETGPLRVRMGLHTGSAEVRDGDYYSSAVNRAARLMSVAHGGQIVVSSITRGLVSEGSVVFIDLGEYRLRDLAEPMRVFQVTHPDLPREFPRIRSLDALPANLPVQLTSFVGREEELAGLAKALDEWRLVTLTGTGGVGKSRLAVQVAADVLPRFRDGAWLCELAVADDDETMGQVVAAALGVSRRFGMSWAGSVSDYLRPMELLLVLDNCEHLIGSARDLAEQVLRECPAVRILTTSREGLGVAGEHVWTLRSLPVPKPTDTNVASCDSVTLFSERAEAARASFSLDVSNAAPVAEICRRLDGIPLAIELAAARVVSMTASEISGLLDERFRLLTGGRKSLERHQTLRATVDWSYSLLTEPERIVFDRLGVFAGSFDAPAAQAVVTGNGIETWDVFDALSELVAKSMIVVEDTAADTTRHQMLETLGQYARERLDEHGDTDRWRRRHAEYFALWAEEAGPGLVGPDEPVWRARENAELNNLRAAVIWALDRADPDDVSLALRIVGALAHEAIDNPAAGIGSLAERALPHVEITSPQLRYAVTAAAALHQQNLGNYHDAQELAQQAIGDGVPPAAPAPADAHATLAISTVLLGDAQGALTIARDAAQWLDHDYPGSPAAVLGHVLVAIMAAAAGDPIARPKAELAVRHARAIGNPTALAGALYAYGMALEADDRFTALAAFDESIALSRQSASPSIVLAAALVEAAGIRVRVGDLPHAARDLRAAIERDHQAGTRSSIYVGVWWGIEILIGFDHLDQAAVFDGIAGTGLPAEHRAVTVGPGVGERELADQRAAVASARATYGPEHYDAAFQTGATMTYDQAVEYTLQVLAAVINETNDARTS
jgi:predicted ATPase/class 3 adenylate cyclase